MVWLKLHILLNDYIQRSQSTYDKHYIPSTIHDCSNMSQSVKLVTGTCVKTDCNWNELDIYY